MDWVFEVILVCGLVGFTAWLSRLAYKFSSAMDTIEDSDDRLDEIRESVEIVAQILAKLPEMMPQFNMQTNPLQPIFEAFASKLRGEMPLMTYPPTGHAQDGRFDGTEKEQEGPAS